MINQRLAELYHIKGIDGSQLQRVSLPEDSPRGGFIGQGSVLKVTANGTATSPILRGVWMMEKILGIPVRPPPPNVPAVEPDASGAVTIREQIEAHRADKACASCHDTIDPLGMALESFDPIGTYRTHYRAGGRPKMVKVEGMKRKQPEPHLSILTSKGRRQQIRLGGEVDPSGKMKDGKMYKDIDEFRKLLLETPDQVAANFARQLMTYATGKGYRFKDRAAINDIVEGSKDTNYGLRSILYGVVKSEIFNEVDETY